MENEQHPDTFQPTENRYSDLEEETFRRGNSGLTGSGLPKGFISTDNESLKHFYLQMSRMMCPSVTADSTECEILHILYTRVKKSCKLLKLLDTHPWSDIDPFLIKACSFYLFTDLSDSQKEKRRLNNILYRLYRSGSVRKGYRDDKINETMQTGKEVNRKKMKIP